MKQFWSEICEGVFAAGTWLWSTLGPVGALVVGLVGLVGLVIGAWKWDAE